MSDWLQLLSDSQLVDKAQQVWGVLAADPAAYSATAGQAADLKTKTDGFESDLATHNSSQAKARADRQTKDGSRNTLENAIRFIVKQARLNGVAEAAILAMGIPAQGSAGSITATRPVAVIDTSQRFQHLLKFADESTPNKKRKPDGVLGAEIYYKIGGEAPADASECAFLTLDTQTPHLIEYGSADVGKMVHYMLRWRMKDESVSAWSETFSATITG